VTVDEQDCVAEFGEHSNHLMPAPFECSAHPAADDAVPGPGFGSAVPTRLASNNLGRWPTPVIVEVDVIAESARINRLDVAAFDEQ
jgi:hypothetical protein